MFLTKLDHQASTSSANQMGKVPISRRKRKTLSCYECRRRKLRCDREEPSCGRCRSTGQGDSCSYEQKPIPKRHEHALASSPSASPPISTSVRRWTPATSHGAPSNGSESVNPTASTARNLGENVGTQAPLVTAQNSGSWQLLGAFSLNSANELRPAIRPDSNVPSIYSRYKPTTPEAVIFRGENFRTHYYGSSNPISLISHFPELRSFMRETIMNRSSLPRVQRELKSFQARWKGVKAGLPPAADFDFLCLLPDKETVDHHVGLYFETVETVYRIIHYPSFLDEYESFWADQRAARPAFVILLLMIMASVSCVASREQPKYIGDSSVTRERAVLFIEISEWWLSRHSHKHIYLAIWQIRCLLLLAKQVNNVKKKRHWAEAGHLIREAMSAGFHRDLNLFGDRVSFFDQEMRRRLWATMLELELQTSIDRGMPSAAVGVSSDSAAALNINDEDLTLDCDHLPISKPLSQYTTCSFLHLSATSFPLRVSVNSLANDLSSRSRYEEVLNYEERILKELEKLPKWTDSSSNDRGSNMAHLLLDIQLRQFLILLHAPFARQTDTTNPRFSLSRMVCLNAACEIIDKHSQLAKSGNHLLLLFRHDYFRGALAICHNMYTSLSVQNNVVFGMNSKILLQYLDRVLVMLEDRISYLGTGYTHYWYICAACALLRSILDPADSKAQMEEAIGKLTRQYHRTLAGQEETRQAERNLIPAALKRMNVSTDQSHFSADISNGVGFGGFGEEFPQIPFDETDVPLDEFFFGNPAAWTFENLWANN